MSRENSIGGGPGAGKGAPPRPAAVQHTLARAVCERRGRHGLAVAARKPPAGEPKESACFSIRVPLPCFGMELLGQHLAEALQLVLWLSAPALAAALLAGLATGMFQAATQVQDSALSFVPRLFAVVAALVASGSFMQAKLVAFTAALLKDVAHVGL
jgi:flagellar biosynthetic protein FliQ